MQHGGIPWIYSSASSHLQGVQFDPELAFLSVWSFPWVLRFPPKNITSGGMETLELALGVNECVH